MIPQQDDPLMLSIEQAVTVYHPTLNDFQRAEFGRILNNALELHEADGNPFRSIGLIAYAASVWKLDPKGDPEEDYTMVRALAAMTHIVADNWYAAIQATNSLGDIEQHANQQQPEQSPQPEPDGEDQDEPRG